MASVLSRAREQAMKGMGAGEWLDNDTLIANQLVFYITDVRDDRGGGFSGNDRWVVRVEPFYDGEEDPDGLISLTDNPARRKFMNVLDEELSSLVEKNEDPVIGPCVMVRLKGRNYRYIEIVDWDDKSKQPTLPPGAIPAGARVEEEMRPPRRPRGGAQAEPEQTQEAQRPFAEAAEVKAEASPARRSAPKNADPDKVREVVERTIPPTRTARSTTDNASAPSASTAAFPESVDSSAFPPIKIWAKANGFEVPEGRGRVKANVKEAYEAAKAAAEGRTVHEVAEKPYQGDTRAVEAELAQNAAEQTRQAEPVIVSTGPSRPSRGEAQGAREVVYRAGMSGRTINPCPACGKHIHDRIFPAVELGPGRYALVHAGCEAGGDQAMMEAIPDQGESE